MMELYTLDGDATRLDLLLARVNCPAEVHAKDQLQRKPCAVILFLPSGLAFEYQMLCNPQRAPLTRTAMGDDGSCRTGTYEACVEI